MSDTVKLASLRLAEACVEDWDEMAVSAEICIQESTGMIVIGCVSYRHVLPGQEATHPVQ